MTIRTRPVTSSAAAGTYIQRWGWPPNRSARYPIRPHPRPNASRTEPVTSGSEPPRATMITRTMARTAPAAMERRIRGTSERLGRLERGTGSPPSFGMGSAWGRAKDARSPDPRSGFAGVPRKRPARWLEMPVVLEHPEHPGQTEHLRWLEPVDRVGRRACRRAVRTVDVA